VTETAGAEAKQTGEAEQAATPAHEAERRGQMRGLVWLALATQGFAVARAMWRGSF